MQREITYAEVGAILGISQRHVRNVLGQHTDIVQPIVYSHVNVRFLVEQILALKRRLRQDAIQRGKDLSVKKRTRKVAA